MIYENYKIGLASFQNPNVILFISVHQPVRLGVTITADFVLLQVIFYGRLVGFPYTSCCLIVHVEWVLIKMNTMTLLRYLFPLM